MPEIDTTNKFIVCAKGDDFAILAPPRGEFSRDDALNLAAWLVALADPVDGDGVQFSEVLAAVEAT